MLKNTFLNARILGFSIVALLGVGGLIYWLSSSDDASLKLQERTDANTKNLEVVTQTQNEVQGEVQGVAQGEAQDEASRVSGGLGLPLGAPSKEASTRPIKVNEKTQVSELPLYKSDCLKADLESQTKELKGHIHEFQLPRKFAKNEELCVFVDGKSVQYSRIDSERVRIDWKIASANTKVSASYCNEGKKCKLTCPAPEKDFWDTIGDVSVSGSGDGFAANESAEEKELQKELKALQDVLHRKPAQAKVALWKIASVSEIACK
jgi:hypothetical protein